VRATLLSAAAEVFARNGYAGASTKEIAQRAGMFETAIYRNYGSKAELFQAAVLEPFVEFTRDYTLAFHAEMETSKNGRELIAACVVQAYDQLDKHRDSVLALITATGEPEAQPAIRQAVAELNEMFESLFGLSREFWEDRGGGFELERAWLWMRMMTGMMVSITALEPLFLADERHRPSREQIRRTASDLLLTGILGVLPDDAGRP
jgi:AcrR family transcriptional regulator